MWPCRRVSIQPHCWSMVRLWSNRPRSSSSSCYAPGSLRGHSTSSTTKRLLSAGHAQMCTRLVVERIVRYDVIDSWNFWESVSRGQELRRATLAEHPEALFLFRSWINRDFVTGPQTSIAVTAGIRTAILGDSVDHPLHSLAGLPRWSRRGHLPGGVRRQLLDQPVDSNEYQQPGWCPLHRVRNAGTRSIRAHSRTIDEWCSVRPCGSDHG